LDRLKDKAIGGVSTDSRSVKECEIFFAIKGIKFDGHDFVNVAFDRGASAAVVERRWFAQNSVRFPDKPLVVVEDTIEALGELSNSYRRKFDIPVLAITGSSGKTTTKEMIEAVLSQKFKVLKTEGNLNNQIGLPLMLFRLNAKHEIAVLEMGTNHFGEIGFLCRVAEPTHGLITNIGLAHLEFFHDLKGVAEEKASLFRWIAGLGARGLAFVNSDDQLIVQHSRTLKRKLKYGLNAHSDIVGKYLGMNQFSQPTLLIKDQKHKRTLQVKLQTAGKHNVFNALAAAAVGLAFGVRMVSIKAALNGYAGSYQRMEVLKIGSIKILNDTYNANPDSTISALDTLRNMACDGKKIIVFADMLELGKQSPEEHKRIGLLVVEFGFGHILTFGTESRVTYETARSKIEHAYHFEDKRELSTYLCNVAEKGDAILIKGSRGMKMEEVVRALTESLDSRKPKEMA
jgi:UDP-N-acetylmuramoyl-tripeptide--D-alanyl-D-alanine ligase